jgi:SAM-dependent methyltransferase
MGESKYIEKERFVSRYADARTLRLSESRARAHEPSDESEWLRSVKEDLPRFIPSLREQCQIDFRGRILEIGAGGAWLSAELSKLPGVVEVITTDHFPKLLKEDAPRIFKLLNAKVSKITRMPGDFHQLDFRDNYFDFVVSSEVLHHATNIVQVLREVKRVLKPGGRFVAIREPVWPLMKIKSRAKMIEKLVKTGINDRFYTLADYEEFFRQASLPMEAVSVNFSGGVKYYVNKMLNGFTHARYAFLGRKNSATAATGQRHKKGAVSTRAG